MARKTMMAGIARLLRKRAGEIAPAFLVSAAVLLVVEHWKHFGWSDIALLVLILTSAAVQVCAREPGSATATDQSRPGKRIRRESQEENHEALR